MGFNMLIVDDSTITRRFLIKSFSKIYSNISLTVTEATNGEEALQILKNNTMDLVLLDLTMPVMTGFEVLEELKHLNIEVPILVISADIQVKAKERVLDMGVLGFIEKPVNEVRTKLLLEELGLL